MKARGSPPVHGTRGLMKGAREDPLLKKYSPPRQTAPHWSSEGPGPGSARVLDLDGLGGGGEGGRRGSWSAVWPAGSDKRSVAELVTRDGTGGGGTESATSSPSRHWSANHLVMPLAPPPSAAAAPPVQLAGLLTPPSMSRSTASTEGGGSISRREFDAHVRGVERSLARLQVRPSSAVSAAWPPAPRPPFTVLGRDKLVWRVRTT
jgi:hypothetical protein